MMKRLLAAACLVSMIFVLSLAAFAAGPYDKYLTAADVSKVSGIAGVKLVAPNPKVGAGGDLNFANADNKMIVMVQFMDAKSYDMMKKYYFKSDVKGIGEAAFQGATIPGNPANFICFKKGMHTVALTAFMDTNASGKNMITIDQVIALSKIILGRL